MRLKFLDPFLEVDSIERQPALPSQTPFFPNANFELALFKIYKCQITMVPGLKTGQALRERAISYASCPSLTHKDLWKAW